MISIFKSKSSRTPLDLGRNDLFTIEDARDIISLKKRMSSFDKDFEHMDNWPFKVKSFESISNEEYKKEKIKLPTFYFHAKAKDLTTPISASGFFSIDVDYDDNKISMDLFGIEYWKKIIFDNIPSVQMIFLSPSRRGLKIIHRINPYWNDKPESHDYVFRKIYEHFESVYLNEGLVTDKQCKNWNRHCFFSYDRELLYRNAVAESIEIKKEYKPVIQYQNYSDAIGYSFGGAKIKCPKCNQNNRFRQYVDSNNIPIAGSGICDRINSCQNHVMPWEIYPEKKWYIKK